MTIMVEESEAKIAASVDNSKRDIAGINTVLAETLANDFRMNI